ncbi:C-GCAxxG-C-C family (seleno)protein [Oscillibacter sp.]|uniref:C-GCAxxG-C-C family protein n=1 Tax=Oscillibacter sp. TaxID=1945593 RepID=UPI003398509A
MDRCELANNYHNRGCNCCQAVLAAFSDVTGLSEAESLAIGGGFGSGAGTGELCGAITGAVMTLSQIFPATIEDPVSGKKRAVGLSKEFQKRFSERFGCLRCAELLPKKYQPDDATPAAKRMQLSNHCAIMIVTAVEIVEEMLGERTA